MSAPRVSDHALLRFLERVGDLDVEALRSAIESSLGRAHAAATLLGGGDHLITVDANTFVVRGGTVTTVIAKRKARDRSMALVKPRSQ